MASLGICKPLKGRHPDTPAKSSNVRKFHEYRKDSAPSDDVRVAKVDVKQDRNRRAHHTDEFDDNYFAVRRGQPFELDIEFNKEIDLQNQDLRIIFSFGKTPKKSNKTDIEFRVKSKKMNVYNWELQQEQKNNKLSVTVLTPPTCFVGRWQLKIDLVIQDGDDIAVHRYKHDFPICILFNPWCKDDSVFMPDENLLDEYVLNDVGVFFRTFEDKDGEKWVYGQFEKHVLDCAMYLLEKKAYMPDTSRGNATSVTRKLSALVNAYDDDGVLCSNWSGKYEGGADPESWASSVPIIKQYMDSTKDDQRPTPVKYGQCATFSGVLTSLCRAIGIPTRNITNINSAHDTDMNLQIDKYINNDGNEGSDSDAIWAYHMWNEVWMKRSDLQTGYDGWQAIDATPQESSDGKMCMGPTPIKAVKLGEVHLPYDGQFLYSEVNADIVILSEWPDGDLRVMSRDTTSIGKLIVTKAVGSKVREDITLQYKYPEGTKENMEAAKKAGLCADNSMRQREAEIDYMKLK